MAAEVTTQVERITKVCTQCGRELELSAFHKQKLGLYGRRATCKECRKIEYINNRESILELRKQYYIDNRDKILEYHVQYNLKNRDKINSYICEYRQTDNGRRKRHIERDKRRQFGESEPLNNWFEDSHEHHLHIYDSTTTIFIPNYLHTSIPHNSSTGQGILEMAIISLLYLSGEHGRLKDGSE
jgi:hypothetical protein